MRALVRPTTRGFRIASRDGIDEPLDGRPNFGILGIERSFPRAPPHVDNICSFRARPSLELASFTWAGRRHGRRGDTQAGLYPAASRISALIALGCETRERWLDFTSTVFAPIRLAMKRWSSGSMVRSSVETA